MLAEPRYYSAMQAAELLFTTEGSVRQMIKRGTLDAIRVGRAVRIPREAVQEALRRRY